MFRELRESELMRRDNPLDVVRVVMSGGGAKAFHVKEEH